MAKFLLYIEKLLICNSELEFNKSFKKTKTVHKFIYIHITKFDYSCNKGCRGGYIKDYVIYSLDYFIYLFILRSSLYPLFHE